MPTVPTDLSGRRFGRLTAIDIAKRTAGRRYYWRCRCDCGGETIVQAGKLLSGHTKSCGCLRHESPPNKTHGLRDDPLYPVWNAMRYRCSKPSNPAYKWYGARGIKVCDEWLEFQGFYDWMHAQGWSEGLTLDRIDPDGDYCPENCRLVTQKVQQNNRRNNIRIEYDGETHTISEWADLLGIKRSTIAERYYRGLNADMILFKGNLSRRD